MEFLSWHYSQGIDYYFRSLNQTLDLIINYFSLGLLLKTLFAPWKRLVEVYTSPGFSFQRKFEVFMFNLISRGIGACVRLALFFTAIIVIFLVALGGIVGIVFWLTLPFFGYPVFKKFKKSPENFVNELIFEIKSTSKNPLEVILNSEAGKFVAEHIGVSVDELVGKAKNLPKNIETLNPKRFTDIISFLLDSGVWSESFFNEKEIAKDDVILASLWWDQERTNESKLLGNEEYTHPSIALDLTFGYTPILNKFSIDLSKPQPFSHHLIGRSGVVNRMQRAFSSGMSVILVGEPGVGKKTVVLEFARKASSGQLGKDLSFKKVLEFDYNFLFSEATDINQKKANLSTILAEASQAGNIILMIRDIHRLINPDVEGYDFTDVFEEYLEKRELKIIAISTGFDYERFIVPNLRIRKFLEKIEVIPPNKDEAMKILIESAQRWEDLTGITVSIPALRHIIEQSDSYVTETPFPEKALELLDAAITFARQNNKKTVNIDDVNTILAEKTGISFASLGEKEKERLSRIEEIIHQRLVNQETAIDLIGKTLRSKMVGVVKEKRPLGSFLFLGPTGVGKTETAKVLAKVYYGSEENIIRFDMAEYAGSEGLERLIGSLKRNVPGVLTTAIKNRPSSLLLLDEIEKASKEIYDIFLALLDEGIITDAFGKKIVCKHLFVIGTSNAGAEYIRELVNKGVKGDKLQRMVVNYVLEKEIFSPEFLNRFDGVVVYEPLAKEHLVKIAQLLLSELSENLRKKNINLNFSDEVAQKLAEDGYDPAFGARPMRRIVNINIGDLIGTALLKGSIKPGDKVKLVAGRKKGEFLLEI